MIPYIDNDASKMIEMLIDPHEIMEGLCNIGQTSGDTYAEKCYDMCNICTYIIGHKLLELCEPGTLKVHEGVFGMMGNHTWLEVEGIIIDMTLQQFLTDANRLSLIDSSYSQYHSVREYEFEDWCENSSNVA